MESRHKRLHSDSRWHARGASLRSVTIGVTVAIVLALAAYLYLANRSSVGPNTEAIDEDEQVILLGGEAGEEGGEARIEIADKNDPSRLAALITTDRFEPVSPTERRVDRPRGWIYFKDGRSLLIESDAGRLTTLPGQQEPTSGVLTGSVKARMYETTPEALQGDPDAFEAAITATFDRPVAFDLELARLSTDGGFTISSERVDVFGSGLWLVLNEQRERIERLEVNEGDRIVYRVSDPSENEAIDRSVARSDAPTPPRGARGTGEGGPVDATKGAAETDSGEALAGTESGDPPKVDLYRIVFEDSVVVEQGDERRLAGDRLDAWVRLIDNAIGGDRETESRSRRTQRAEADRRSDRGDDGTDRVVSEAGAEPVIAEGGVPEGTPTAAESPVADEVILTWTGPMTLTPLDAGVPAELEEDDVAVRVTALESGVVTFEDRPGAAIGQATAISYGLDSGVALLTGSAGSVRLATERAGRLEGASRLRLDTKNGIVEIAGPGGLYGRRDDPTPDAGRREFIEWTDWARFGFAVADGQMTDTLESADIRGRVRGQSREATIAAEDLSAQFVDEGEASPRLSSVEMFAAIASDGRGASLVGDRVRIDFAYASVDGEPFDPTRMQAWGGVRGRRADGAQIESDELSVMLSRDVAGQITATDAWADGSVMFTDGGEIDARGERLVADLVTQRASVFTLGALLDPQVGGATVRNGASVVSGPWIDLDASSGALAVDGRGRFEHTTGEEGDRRRVVARWLEQMRYSDETGVLTASGGVRADAIGALQEDRVTAQRLRVQLTEGDPGAGDSNEADESIALGGGRSLARAIAYGDGERLARVESSRYISDENADEGRRLVEGFLLEGLEIDLLETESRVVAPGPGRMLVVNGDPAGVESPDANDSASTQIPSPDEPGQALFIWSDGLTYDRTLGEATLRGDVRIGHVRSVDGSLTRGNAQEVTVRFASSEGSDGGAGANLDGADLLSLNARGRVSFESEGRRLSAERAFYDAKNGDLTASGLDTVVRVTDDAGGPAIVARELRWNLISNRIEVIRPAPVTAPR